LSCEQLNTPDGRRHGSQLSTYDSRLVSIQNATVIWKIDFDFGVAWPVRR
jgi:hypothetical protein